VIPYPIGWILGIVAAILFLIETLQHHTASV
jgi:hypothetical protein